jgi:peptidoglycan/xylan/chitin deacetylase (PgdA/CDA1 family)
MSRFFNRQQITASALIGTGVGRLARHTRRDEARILTFHGVRDDASGSGLLDRGLHTPLRLFRELCTHLAANYRVRPLTEIVGMLRRGDALPERTIAITFDDGYESNHLLAWPVLRDLALPATVFLCTGFIDGTVNPWFHRLELALARATVNRASGRVGDQHFEFPLHSFPARQNALAALSPAFKKLPNAEMETTLRELEQAVEPAAGETPAPLRAMSWNHAREMLSGGLIEFGAHTHSHPILGRCTVSAAREEIFHSRDRITAELKIRPALFAYPNGRVSDYDTTTQASLREAGFTAAFTMNPGTAFPGTDVYELPRYGSPESVTEAEATVSGAFETFKEWRRHLRQALSPTA